MKGGEVLLATSSALVLALVIAGSLQGGADRDCSECHSGNRPEGNFIYKDPEVQVFAPRNVTAGVTFQVLVIVETVGGYDLLDPMAGLDLSGLPGSSSDHDRIDLASTGDRWQGVFKVTCGDEVPEGSVISVRVSFVVHYDHFDADDPDVLFKEVRKDLLIGPFQAPVDVGPPEEDANDVPMGMLVPVFGMAIVPGVYAWRKAARRRA